MGRGEYKRNRCGVGLSFLHTHSCRCRCPLELFTIKGQEQIAAEVVVPLGNVRRLVTGILPSIAKSLDLKVPSSVLVRVDEVIR